MIKKTHLIFLLFLSFFTILSCKEKQSSTQLLQKEALQQLQNNLAQQSEWVKVHAAEFLIDLNQKEGIEPIFKLELEKHGNSKYYRIGIWRVLSQVSANPDQWIEKVITVARDTTAKDQLHAIETLAKRKVAPTWLDENLKDFIFQKGTKRLQTYTQWALACPSSNKKIPQLDSLKIMLRSSDLQEKRIAALGIFKLNFYPPSEWSTLAKIASKEPIDSKAKIFLLAAALRTCPDRQLTQYQLLKKNLADFARSAQKIDRYFFCETLAQVGTEQDLEVLSDLLFNRYPIQLASDSEKAALWNSDVSAAAAFAILKINNFREKK